MWSRCDSTYANYAVPGKISMVGEGIQTRAGTSLIATLQIRRLELVVAINYQESGQNGIIQ